MRTLKPHNYLKDGQTFGGKVSLRTLKKKTNNGAVRYKRNCMDCMENIAPCHYMTIRCKACQYKSFLKKSREVYSKKHTCKECGIKTTIRSKNYCKVCDNKLNPRGVAIRS